MAAVVLLVSGVAAEARATDDESKLACLLRPSASGLDDRELSLFEGALNAALKRQQVLPTSPRERESPGGQSQRSISQVERVRKSSNGIGKPGLPMRRKRSATCSMRATRSLAGAHLRRRKQV